MERGGSRSWQFGHGIEQLPHAALFVRDAIGLEPPAAADIPPPLSGRLPNRRDVLDGAGRAQAAAQWPHWWRAIIRYQARTYQGGEDGPRARLDELMTIADTPDFAALADRPALRQAVKATFNEACEWVGDRQPRWLQAARRSSFEWHLVRNVAEEVAARHGVSQGSVRGYAVVLAVRGNWWAAYGPRVAACSLPCSQDPDTARTLLTQTFESGLPEG